MTTTANDRRKEYAGNGIATEFAGPRAFQADQLAVYLVNDDTGEETLTTEYTLENVGVRSRATKVTMDTAPPAGVTLLILRTVENEQTADITNQGAYLPQVVEDALDNLAQQVQQLADNSDRTLRFPETMVGDLPVAELPRPEEASVLGWGPDLRLRNLSVVDLATNAAYANKSYDTFTGTGAQVDFTLSQDPGSLGNLAISIDGAVKVPVVDFTFTGTTLTFTTAPDLDAEILVRYDAALPNGVALAEGVFFTQAGTGAAQRTAQAKLRDVVNVKDFGALVDGATNDYAAVLLAINSGAKHIVIPPGTMCVGTTINIPQGVTIYGPGAVWKVPQGVNAVNMHANGCTIRDVTFDGTAVNDLTGATGVILGSDGTCVNVTCQNFGFHGFGTPTAIGSHRNSLIGCRAINTGHRGINLSNGSTYNRVTNFQARDCARAGIILGYLSNYNVFSDIYIDGHSVTVGGAGLWVHMNSNYNQFTNITVGAQNPAGTTCPSLILGAGCQGNTFHNIKLRAVGTRGILLWNQDVDHPELGTSNAPLQYNRFTNVDILGTQLASSAGILFQNQGAITPNICQYNIFDKVLIVGFTDGVYDTDTLSVGNEFNNIQFSGISSRKFRVGSTADSFRSGRRRNCGAGVSSVGSLAVGITEYAAQPAVAATGVAVTQCYPFPVNIYVADMPAGSNVQINGVNVGNPTAPGDGNGVHRVEPGQTIALIYASGSPRWRWFGLD